MLGASSTDGCYTTFRWYFVDYSWTYSLLGLTGTCVIQREVWVSKLDLKSGGKVRVLDPGLKPQQCISHCGSWIPDHYSWQWSFAGRLCILATQNGAPIGTGHRQVYYLLLGIVALKVALLMI